MSDTVSLQIEWTTNKALQASKALYDYEMKHSLKRYIGWLFIALMQFGIVALFKHQNPMLFLVSSFLVVYWYYGRWYLRRRLIEKFYKKQNLKKNIIKFSCNDEKLTIGNEKLSWDDILYAIDTQNALLLQTQNETLYLPYDAFKDIEDISKCTHFLKSKGKLR